MSSGAAAISLPNAVQPWRNSPNALLPESNVVLAPSHPKNPDASVSAIDRTRRSSSESSMSGFMPVTVRTCGFANRSIADFDVARLFCSSSDDNCMSSMTFFNSTVPIAAAASAAAHGPAMNDENLLAPACAIATDFDTAGMLDSDSTPNAIRNSAIFGTASRNAPPARAAAPARATPTATTVCTPSGMSENAVASPPTTSATAVKAGRNTFPKSIAASFTRFDMTCSFDAAVA